MALHRPPAIQQGQGTVGWALKTRAFCTQGIVTSCKAVCCMHFFSILDSGVQMELFA